MTCIERDMEFELAARPALWQRLGGTVGRIWGRYVQWRRARETLRHLVEAEDWLLDDIGITRAELDQMLAGQGLARDRATPDQMR